MRGESHTQGANRLGRFLTRAGFLAALPYLAIGVLLASAVVAAGWEIDKHLDALQAWITQLGPWGPIAFVVLFVLATSLLVPDTVFCIVAGAVFAMGWGVAAVVSGSLLAAALQYALARRFLRARVERTLLAKPSLAAIQRAVIQDELRLQALLRLTPVNPATISYLLGATGVRFSGFMMACLALIPSLIIAVYFGHAGEHLARMTTGDSQGGQLHDIATVVGLAVSVIVVVLVSRMARRAVLQSESGADNDTV